MIMKPDIMGTMIAKAAAFFKKEETITAETFQCLLNPIKENLYNFIFKALNFCEDANDIYQETILRAFKYRGSFKQQGSFKTWIFTIAHNQVKGYFNQLKKMPGVELEDQLIVEDADAGNEILVHDIYEVARQLTPQQRRVFFLFYDQGFSIREIIEITGLKQGNIKFILNQAREKIKQKLGVKNEQ